jgi:hypothetical protein
MKLFNKNIFIFTCLILSAILFLSCSQTSTGIYKTWSFYKSNTPGNIPVDDNGNVIGKKHDTTYVIYFETKKNEEPKLLGASFKGNFYKLNFYKEESSVVEVGNRLPDNKIVTLKAGSSRQLWKAELGNIITSNTEQTKIKSLLAIVVEHEGRKASRLIKKHTELVPELHY